MAAPAIPTQTLKYSIVVPCFNEQDNIGPLIREIITALDGLTSFEIIVVDDCSTDLSAQRLVELKEVLDFPFRVVVHSVNAGQSAAICTGADMASGQWLATLDGDGQNDPADIPLLIAELEQIQARQEAPAAPPIICGYRKR